MLLLFLPLLITALVQTNPITIEIGVMLPRKGKLTFTNSAAAIPVAIDEAKSRQYIPKDFVFKIAHRDVGCTPVSAVGAAIELITVEGVKLLLGPVCNYAAMAVSSIAASYNTANFLWGPVPSSALNNENVYPSTTTVVIDAYRIALAVISLMKHFAWKEFAFFYTLSGEGRPCQYFEEDMEDLSEEPMSSEQSRAGSDVGGVTVTFKRAVDFDSQYATQQALQDLKSRARIVVVCFGRRHEISAFMLAAHLENMTTSDYVYIIPDTVAGVYVDEHGNYLWHSSGGVDSTLRQAFRTAIVLSSFRISNSKSLQRKIEMFEHAVIERSRKPPFNCLNCTSVPFSTRYLYDAVLLYAWALNKTMEKVINYTEKTFADGILIRNETNGQFEVIKQNEFSGLTETVNIVIGKGTVRDAHFFIEAMNVSGEIQTFGEIRWEDGGPVFDAYYTNESGSIWNIRDGIRPLFRPLCGFSHELCKNDDHNNGYVIYYVLGTCLFSCVVIAFSGFIYRFHRQKMRQNGLSDMTWRIPFDMLHKLDTCKQINSTYSLQSKNSSKYTAFAIQRENENYSVFVFEGELVLAKRHNVLYQLDDADRVEICKMRGLNHENLNYFIGLSLENYKLISIWKFSSRGTLVDILENSKIKMDAFFKYSLMMDIISGLQAVHNSYLSYHGRLTSRCCIISERWQLKLSEYGPKFLPDKDSVDDDLLWTAPEILREGSKGSKEGDIYSFGIICSEILTRRRVWDLNNRSESAEEIVYTVKKGGLAVPLRPSLFDATKSDISAAVVELVNECWSEDPGMRPKIARMKQQLGAISKGRASNLMDHIFSVLEEYTDSLEGKVNERTEELIVEKKKAEFLLYRMLPKQVADALKSGSAIQQESFERATVFFSDIVDFGKFSAKCTPLQIVKVLGDLYTMYDSVISEYDVYKVETVGGGYLCVSGLPERNGNNHAKQIALMALAFMENSAKFRIAHLPDERISLRIGIHTGAVVAGIVGLTLPRYCLFGDTVNTASRMESSGKAGCIQLTSATNSILINDIGGFRTRSRGEVMIKGKGVMETFWLLGYDPPPPPPEHRMTTRTLWKEYIASDTSN